MFLVLELILGLYLFITTNIALTVPSCESFMIILFIFSLSYYSPSRKPGVSININLSLVPFQNTSLYAVYTVHVFLPADTLKASPSKSQVD